MSRLFEALQLSAQEQFGPSLVQLPATLPELLASTKPIDRLAEARPLRESLPANSRLVAFRDEESLAAEKFRFLAVRLRYLQQRHPLKKLLVTSAVSEEGKSFVSMNLAVTLARKQRQKVLLIEGDLRRPGISPEFGLGHLPGLCECLANEHDPLSYIVHLQHAQTWFMPAGTPPENPLELMQSRRLPEFTSQIMTWFDWIIIDSPPLLPLADTTVWSRIADGILLVVREGRTERGPLKRGLDNLGKADLVGVVVNDCSDVDQTNYYQRYGALGVPRSE
jgi:protein-tyrosine kinase